MMDADALAALCAAAMPDEGLDTAQLRRGCLEQDDDTAVDVIGDEQGAAVVIARAGIDATHAWLLLLAVDPGARGRHRGRELTAAAADWALAQGAVDLHLGSGVPRYLWHGCDLHAAHAITLFESMGFEPYAGAYNMALPTDFTAPIPAGVHLARDVEGALTLAARAFPEWIDEVTRAGTVDGVITAFDADDVAIAFGCHSANRDGWIGPMATDPDRRTRGVGHAVLAAIGHDVRNSFGWAHTEICAVGPYGFYAKAGARVSRVFHHARLPLAP